MVSLFNNFYSSVFLYPVFLISHDEGFYVNPKVFRIVFLTCFGSRRMYMKSPGKTFTESISN